MKSYLFLFTLVLFCSVRLAAQPYVIKGAVTDTLNAVPLTSASVVLIRSSDSVIAGHARTNTTGRFEARVNTKGKYLLRVTFPGFADFIDEVTINKATTDLGDLPLISRSNLLKEFVLTQQVSAIKIKGDTTEYMADSFQVREGATVEELLKKLPGIQVDKNGQIVAQGETVQRVLVDGEEFFSDDPKVVTRGIQADAVSKVQVYDKKSDQAEFTGIDDGEKTKTINLELKEDKKKGYFGKVDAGQGTDGYFQEQAMVNAFKGKRQLSAFAIGSNTDKAGLGWQDNDKFGSGNGTTEISDEGSVVSTYSSSDEDFTGWNGKYNGEGLPTTWTGGAHYADKWKEGKQHLSANYRFARQNVVIDGNTLNQYSLPLDSLRITDVEKDQYSSGDRHGLDIVYDWKLDSTTTLKITANSGAKSSFTNSNYHTEAYIDAADAPGARSINDRNITSDANSQFLNTDFLLRKKFRKKGRTLSVDVKENYKDTKSTGILTSTTVFNSSSADTKQKKINNAGMLAFAGKATYTEPLSKVAFAEINYGASVTNSTAENKSFDTVAGGGYSDDANPFFSSDYKFDIIANSGGLNFKFVYKKINFSFGSNVSKTDYVQVNRFDGDSTRTYSFNNIFPKASFTYKISRQTSFRLNYQGSTQQPTISQIQPLRQNTDPLNIAIGNTSLRQEFRNTISVGFNDYKVLHNRYLFFNASLTSVADGISTEQVTTGAINTTRFINVAGNYNGNGYLGYGEKVGNSDFMAGAQINASAYHINSIINAKANASDNRSISVGPYISYEKENKMELRWSPRVLYNNNTSTNNPAIISYYILNNELSGSVQLPMRMEVGSSLDMMIRQKTALFNTNNNVNRWNAYVEKKFLKKGELALRLSVFDILNQNLGFSRTASGNMVTQNSYNTIRRYGMVNLVWNFTHTPAGAPAQPGGGMFMITK